MKKAKITILSILFLLFNVNSLSAQKSPFSLNPLSDGIMLGTGLTLNASTLICSKLVKVKQKIDINTFNFNPSSINKFDSLWYNPYSKKTDRISDVLLAATAVMPAFGAFVVPSEDILSLGIMYAETLLLANGTKDLLKLCINRARPYMYFDGYPEKDVADGDWCCSFPSGHTTIAFAAAGFSTFVFSKYYPDSPWRFAVAGGSYAFAITVALLRIKGGCHFMTDVITGAAIGSLYGYLVPYLHTLNKKSENRKINANLLPAGFNISINF